MAVKVRWLPIVLNVIPVLKVVKLALPQMAPLLVAQSVLQDST